MISFREFLDEQSLNEDNSKFQKELENILDRCEKNLEQTEPGTGRYRYYKEFQQNYTLLLKKFKKMNFSKKTYSGLEAIIILYTLPVGSKAEFKAGIYPEAVYTRSHVPSTKIMNGGDIWKCDNDEVKYSFGVNYGTIAQVLHLIKSDLFQDDKSVKVKIVK